jgi:hypothetical protein
MKLLKLLDSINWITGNKSRKTQRGLNDNVDKVSEENAPLVPSKMRSSYNIMQKTLEHLEYNSWRTSMTY